jgi:hypothetical protein
VGGPILLTHPHELPAATRQELVRILAPGGTVHLLGGEAAIDPDVEATIASFGLHTVRHSGADRYATAVAVADAIGDPQGAWLADGTDFPDAVVASGAAARWSRAGGDSCCHVVLLTRGSELPQVTADALTRYRNRYAVGGRAAAAWPDATPYVGADRYETAAILITAHMGIYRSLVTGANWPDALTAGALGGPPLLLPPEGRVPASVAEVIRGRHGSNTIVGGPAAVSEAIADQVRAILSDR